MSEEMGIGKLRKSYYEAFQVEWEVADFSLTRDIFIGSSPVFSFEENTWTLQLCTEPAFPVPKMFLGLVKVGGNYEWKEKIKCKLGLKNIDDTVKYFRPCFTQKFGTDSITVIEQPSLQSPYLLSPNTLTIICTLLKDTGSFAKPSAMAELAAPLKLIKLDTLSENFKNLFAHKDSCDVILRVKEKDFHAHKTILMARSNVFASMFHHDSLENQTGIITIPDCDPDSFHHFLEYLYSGKLDDISFEAILHLYSTSDKYNAQELKTFCVEYMTQNLNEDNVCDIVILSDLYEEATLFSASQDFFNKNANKVVETPHWESLLKKNYRLANRLIKDVLSKSTIGGGHSTK